MEDLYNKMRELCSQLNTLTMDELRENGVEAIMIHCIGRNLTGVQYAKGNLPSILSILGSNLESVSKKAEIPLRDLLDMIYENEQLIKRDKGEGDQE